VFVGGAMRVVVDVTDDDSQRVGAADWGTAAISHDHRDVSLCLRLSVCLSLLSVWYFKHC